MTSLNGYSESTFDSLDVDILHCSKLEARTITADDIITTTDITADDVTTTSLETDILNVGNGTLYASGPLQKVGINTTSPTEALDVVGNVKIGGTLNVQNNAIYVSPSNGWVGINSNNPSARLYVNGACTVNGIVYSYGISTTGNCTVTGTVSAGSGFQSAFALVATKLTIYRQETAISFINTDTVNGKVGIGDNNTAPSEVLDVIGNIKYTGELKLPTTTFVTPTSGSLGYSDTFYLSGTKTYSASVTRSSVVSGNVPTGLWLVIPKIDIRGTNSTTTISFYNIEFDFDGTEVWQCSSYQSFLASNTSSVQETIPMGSFTVTNTSTTSKTLEMFISITFSGAELRINATANQCYLKIIRLA